MATRGKSPANVHLKRLAFDDLLAAVVGVPVGALRKITEHVVSRLFPWLAGAYYLRDDPDEWIEFYKSEQSNMIPFPFRDSPQRIAQTVIFDNTDCRYIQEQIFFRFDRAGSGKSFSLPSWVRGRTERHYQRFRRRQRTMRARFRNEPNLRLININEQPDRVLLLVEEVVYEDYARSNLCLDAKDSSSESSLREILHPEGKIEPLIGSPLGNNLGINCLLFTADDHLILQRRSRWVLVRPHQLAPSYSGTVAYTDVQQKGTRLDQFHIIREGYEELGLRSDDVVRDSVRLLGITRELVRGGEPELFFVASLKATKRDVIMKYKDAAHRWESAALEFYDFGGGLNTDRDHQNFKRNIETFVRRYQRDMSVPLMANLALWICSKLGGVAK